MTHIIRSLRSGQITIPAQLREKLGIDRDSLLQLTLEEGELRIKPVQVTNAQEVTSAWLKKLYDQLSRVREEAKGYSGKLINQSIDQAVSQARSSHG